MRNLNHLSEVFHSYDTYVIDLWGVMHNGIALNPKAIEVVENLSESSKKIVFLSNAPRPSFKVVEFSKKIQSEIFTLSTMEKESVSKIKAKLISYVS